MRVLCAVHVHLGLVAALRRHPELGGEPVIVGGAPELRLPVIAASAAARTAGVRPGQPLRLAQQLCPAAAFVSFDPAAVRRLQAELRCALGRHSPMVEAGVDEIFCDVTGTHAAFGDEASWTATIARSLDMTLQAGPPAVGVAGSRFVARMAARRSEPGRIRRVKPGDEAGFLAPLPLDVLPLDQAVTSRLAAFGLDCLGAVASLAPADLQRQFGSQGARIHELVRGADGDGVHAEADAPAWSERLVLDGPVGDLEVLLHAVRHCAEALGVRLSTDGLCAEEMTVAYDLDGAVAAIATEVAPSPFANAAETWTAALGLLNRLHPAHPVTAVRVTVGRLAAAHGRQTDMWRAGDAARDGVALVAGRLRARYGEATVRRAALTLDPGDIPERRYSWQATVMSPSA